MIRLLLDENISPALVRRLGDMGVYAQAVPNVGLPGHSDREIWMYALDHDIRGCQLECANFSFRAKASKVYVEGKWSPADWLTYGREIQGDGSSRYSG